MNPIGSRNPDRDRVIVHMRKERYTQAQIAQFFGLSHQRVQKILAKERKHPGWADLAPVRPS